MKLSILLITYNQEKSVEKALQSILIQNIHCDYEVILADDCSTDATQIILNNYCHQYPHIFKAHFAENNLGITKNYERAFKLCQGEFIAVLEGDDYWIAPHKIMKQIQLLEAHPDWAICFNRMWLAIEKTKEYLPHPNLSLQSPEAEYQICTLEQLIHQNFIGNFSTCMYRASAIKQVDPDLFNLKAYDWLLNICVAQHGKIAYLPEIMSVYSLHTNGAWSKLDTIKKLTDIIAALKAYNQFFNYKYAKAFTSAIRIYRKQLVKATYLKKLKQNPKLYALLHFSYRMLRATTPPIVKSFITKLT